MAGTGKAHLRDDHRTLLRVEDLVVEFSVGRRGQRVFAVSGISFDVLERETLGIVGESGCGKSTTGRAVMHLPRPTSGRVWLDGTELTELNDEEIRRSRPKMQLIFQDAISSLNPRRKIRDVVAEGLDVWGSGGQSVDSRVNAALVAVGLDPEAVGDRRSHQFSGGQCQRICIARALIMEPKMLICDEPVSALDVSVQAQIINLLEQMKIQHELTMIFISHDLAVIKNVSDRIMVMYLGKVCEIAEPDELFLAPMHHYTNVLLSSIPGLGKDVTVPGEPPSPIDPPSGCRFHSRCPAATAKCAADEPEIRELRPGHFVACHHPVLPTHTSSLEPGEPVSVGASRSSA